MICFIRHGFFLTPNNWQYSAIFKEKRNIFLPHVSLVLDFGLLAYHCFSNMIVEKCCVLAKTITSSANVCVKFSNQNTQLYKFGEKKMLSIQSNIRIWSLYNKKSKLNIANEMPSSRCIYNACWCFQILFCATPIILTVIAHRTRSIFTLLILIWLVKFLLCLKFSKFIVWLSMWR